jgi:hypothetical protein
MKKTPFSFNIARTQFDLFLEQRELIFLDFKINHKNPKQYLGVCSNYKTGREDYYLISENGNYYLRDHQTEKWNPVPYVLKRGDNDD